MDPVKCIEILSNRGVCRGPHTDLDPHEEHCAHGRGPSDDPAQEPPAPVDQADQAVAAAAAAAMASVGGPGQGGGQVINLATGANETAAASQAESILAESLRPRAVAAPLDSAGAGAEVPTLAARREGTISDEAMDARGTGGHGGPGRVAGNEGSSLRAVNGAQHEVKADAANGFVERLGGMTPGALVASFRRAQEERVALYKRFDGGLKDALRSGDYSGYPALCCEVTAAFSVLSKAINSIEARYIVPGITRYWNYLEDYWPCASGLSTVNAVAKSGKNPALLAANGETKPLAGIIRKVQGHEKELLTVTAACHLESMRETRALGMGPGRTVHAGNGGAPSVSPVQERLLKESVRELRCRADGEAASVMELLEELRYEAEGLL